MPRQKEPLELKQERLETAAKALESTKQLIEQAPPESRAQYQDILKTVEEQYEAARKSVDNAKESEFREAEDEFNDKVVKPILGPGIRELITEMESATDEIMGEGFWSSRVNGRDLTVRVSIGAEDKSMNFGLVNARESKPRTFRITSFSGNLSENVSQALRELGAEDISKVGWKNQKTFLNMLCRTTPKTSDKGKEYVEFQYAGHVCKTPNEMIRVLEDEFSFEADHVEAEALAEKLGGENYIIG